MDGGVSGYKENARTSWNLGACSGARNLNDSRMLTGDILTLNHLSLDGNILIDLWKSIIVAKGDPAATTLQSFPGKSWEAFLKSEENRPSNKLRENILGEMKVLRTKLIYFVVWFTSYSFLDIPRPPIMVRKNHGTTRNRTDAQKERSKLEKELRKMSLGNATAKQICREDRAAVLERMSTRMEQCQHCLRGQLPEEKFQRCSRCWDKLQRSVYYCSKDCQVAAYKPTHKAICGKVLDVKTATAAAASSVSPAKAPGGR
ncbi:hypothetical protein BT96DRAFT_1007752 [Gymnopus androsaceus JB14]|uniref:MYND-type domain-containing protein n=1 Tax=Gymnopus androsaceus JB14 TaxID=1447944 RepID=A0A6A4GH11_9AGAR|nr:hypothetical protein BT96DRAFT_1007752 [Gymnopus androsaceus JB14]